MGAWGTALYSNDTASDIRGDYVDLLRRGNSNEESLKKLMEKDGDCIKTFPVCRTIEVRQTD